MYKDQNGQEVSAGNGRRYAFGLGSQKQAVQLRYDVDADELLVAFGKSNEWTRASEFTGFSFSEIDPDGVEIPIADAAELLAKRLLHCDAKAFELRLYQTGIVEQIRSMLVEVREVTDVDELAIRRFVYEGVGTVDQLVTSFTKQTA